MSERPFVWRKSWPAVLVVAGLVLAAVGTVLASAAWPATELTQTVCISLEPDGCAGAGVSETGSRGWANVGLALVGLGLLVLLVGYGVQRRMREADDVRSS
jgi:hypothetical protein